MADGSGVPAGAHKPLTSRQRRLLMESALDRFLSAVDGVLADLDALDGDPDLEDQCEDEGAQCEGEGDQCDDEGAVEYETGCEYADDGWDQTRIAGCARGIEVSPLGVR